MTFITTVQRAMLRAAMLLALAAVAVPVAAQSDIVLAPSSGASRVGNWSVVSDSTAAGGAVVRHPNAGGAKLAAALASPIHYFEMTFDATAGVPYRLWFHAKAESNYWGNDSVFVQFAGSVTSAGAATWRIGTTSAADMNLEECSGCGLNGWQWQDNGWGTGVFGPTVYFATSGTQRMRVQTREDGLSVDQILLSSTTYMSAAPVGTIGGTPPPPPPPPPPPAGTALKVFHWNTHHGVGTDGVYNLQRFVDWMILSGANVVSLNEVEKKNPSWGNEDQPARYAALLTAQTGTTWYYNFAQRDGVVNGQGNLLLTTFAIEDEDDYVLSYSRSVARVRVLVNGFHVNLFSTHLDDASAARRGVEYDELTAYASQFTEQRIIAGDFNASATSAEIKKVNATYFDAWAVAKSAGVAVAYAGNEAGNTRNSRIDYVWYSKSASRLFLKAMRVYDTRDAGGVMPSDHRPIMTTYEVR